VNKKEFLYLLDKYLAGNASPEEEQFLFDVYQDMEDKYKWTAPETDSLNQMEDRLIERFRLSIQKPVAAIPDEHKEVIKPRFYRRTFFQVAASLLLVISVIAWYKQYRSSSDRAGSIFVSPVPENLVTHINNTNRTEKIVFPDDSYAELTAGSKVVYSKDFSGSLRQVYLAGEGFFQVTKNHTKPFIVYTDKVVAKVLGTSFVVKSGINDSKASVLVKTGKVSVFKTSEFTIAEAKPDLVEGIVLRPNHLANINAKQELQEQLSRSPEVIKKQEPAEFTFDNTPIDIVFSKLQDAYEINIDYDKAVFSSCTITVDMGKEDYYQKLDLICRTINASYQVRDGKIFVSGKGCAN